MAIDAASVGLTDGELVMKMQAGIWYLCEVPSVLTGRTYQTKAMAWERQLFSRSLLRQAYVGS